MHLVLGIDDSECSTVAIDFVCGMAWPGGTTATVISSLPPMMVAVPEAYMVMSEQLEQLRHEQLVANRKNVEAAAAKLSSAGLKATGQAIDGDPRETLLQTARAEHADLIVVGSHGRTGLSKLFLGSVASHVSAHAPCSVLIVRRRPAS